MTLRFGWFSHGHQALNTGAFARLPASPWKTYLQSNALDIEKHTILTDYVDAGPEHFFNIDRHGRQRLAQPLKQRAWSTVRDVYSPRNLAKIQQNWQKTPLNSASLVSKQNLADAVFEAARLVYVQLYRIKEGLPNPEGGRLDDVSRRCFYERLKSNIGVLAHLVGDMYMPMHWTDWSWPVGGPSDKGMHFFAEGVVFKKSQDYEPTETTKMDGPLTPVDIPTLASTVVEEIKQNLPRLFDMVAVQKKVLPQYEGGNQKGAYHRALATELKPLLLGQHQQAQQMLASILQAVWVLADKPRIKN